MVRVKYTNPRSKELEKRVSELEQEDLAKSRLLHGTVEKNIYWENAK